VCFNPTEGMNSVGGIATGYGLDDRGIEFRVPVRARSFLSLILRVVKSGRVFGVVL
jgi:hypothetical protein